MMPREEPNVIWLNGEFTNAASLPALSSAAMYGKGVFTTVRIIDGEPWLLERHRERLLRNASAVGIDRTVFGETDIHTVLSELLRRFGIADGRARLTLFDGSQAPYWSTGSPASALLMMNAAPLRPVSRPFDITVSPYLLNSASPLAGIKSCNYLENILALEEARSRGFTEAIRLNEHGKIASAAMANVFWRRDGRLFTPALETGCLDGTTRAFVLENIEVEESVADLNELAQADAVYLTSAGLGIVAADSLNGRRLQTDGPSLSGPMERLTT